jgi:hypothetical protein
VVDFLWLKSSFFVREALENYSLGKCWAILQDISPAKDTFENSPAQLMIILPSFPLFSLFLGTILKIPQKVGTGDIFPKF